MKPENTFIASVHRHLPKVYFEKMHNMYRCGTADVWYSGCRGDLWIEYKFLKALPKIITPALTKLQEKWLCDRAGEGRNTAVVVGWKDGGVVFDATRDMNVAREDFIAHTMPRRQLAAWILSQTGVSFCRSPKRSSSPPAL